LKLKLPTKIKSPEAAKAPSSREIKGEPEAMHLIKPLLNLKLQLASLPKEAHSFQRREKTHLRTVKIMGSKMSTTLVKVAAVARNTTETRLSPALATENKSSRK